MNALSNAVKNALDTEGSLQQANKAYLEFIKANFIIPVEQDSTDSEPRVLFFQEGQNVFLPVFTEMHYLNTWAADIAENIQLLKLSGVDLLKGIGDEVTICLDIGSNAYKEFNSAEIARMRSMVLKFFKD